MTANTRTARVLAVGGAALIGIAIVVSVTNDDTVDRAWGAMILATLAGLLLLVMSAVVALRRRGHAARSTTR